MNQEAKTTTPVPRLARHWDIFCRIVDNYGDIGVCWRLARQLAHEHSLMVRLWVDDLAVAARLIGGLDANSAVQSIDGVEIQRWDSPHHAPFQACQAADVVIEAFACELPEPYLQSMVRRKPLWLNLEYLSAESWVEDFHLQSSPHPVLPLTKYFFFPGFTEKTGGLLREKNLAGTRKRFQSSASQQTAFRERLGIEGDDVKVSLFCYPYAPVSSLLDAMSASSTPVLCLIPESAILPEAGRYFAAGKLGCGDKLEKNNLTLQVLPFLSQDDYDRLLWACDINFVRGEDSWVRALWAAKPLVWQPYRQDEDTHLSKLDAFMENYLQGLEDEPGKALRQCHTAWAGKGFSRENWQSVLEHLPALQHHAGIQENLLSGQTDLASKLVIFCENYF